MLRFAASSPWGILVFWAFILLVAKAGKKKAQPPRPDGSRVELGDALQRAMEKLKQAEREAQPARIARRRPEPAAVDYDEEAVRLEETRVSEEAAAFERTDTGLAPRIVVSAATPSAPMQPTRAPARRSVLAQFATGSPRGAIVLAEILGRPVSDR
jgi:hypothetical protein